MSSPADNPGASPPKKRRKYHPAPALAIAALIAVMAVAYMVMRSARVGDQLPTETRLGLSIPVPQGWRLAGQKSPSGADGRVALGSPGATSQAMFITRYRLSSPAGDPASHAASVERSLARSGAPGNVKVSKTKVAGQPALQGAFKASGLEVKVLVMFSGRDSWQLSCQSMPGRAGSSTRERCEQVTGSLRVG